MQAIQFVIDDALLSATDRVVRRLKVNRSALIRTALREHLKHLSTLDKERRDREGYSRRPAPEDELSEWDAVSAWPDD